MPEKARGGVLGLLVHTTNVANDLLQTNYVTATIAGKMDPFKSAAQAEQMWSFVKRFLCSVHFKRHREAG